MSTSSPVLHGLRFRVYEDIRDNAGYTMLVNIGLVLVLGVTCLRAIYILFKKSYDSYVLLFEDEGSIRISDKSIERTIRHAADQIEEIDQVDISVKARNKNDGNPDVKINIKCGLDYAKYMQASYFPRRAPAVYDAR